MPCWAASSPGRDQVGPVAARRRPERSTEDRARARVARRPPPDGAPTAAPSWGSEGPTGGAVRRGVGRHGALLGRRRGGAPAHGRSAAVEGVESRFPESPGRGRCRRSRSPRCRAAAHDVLVLGASPRPGLVVVSAPNEKYGGCRRHTKPSTFVSAGNPMAVASTTRANACPSSSCRCRVVGGPGHARGVGVADGGEVRRRTDGAIATEVLVGGRWATPAAVALK